MSEDNVVRPAFGAQKAITVENTAPVSEVDTSADGTYDFEEDIEYCLQNLELVWQAHLRGDEMTNYLFDDVKYNKNDGSLQLRRPIVSTYTFEQFCTRLLTSSRAEWRAQPAFFGALFVEFHERQNFILSALEERQQGVKELAKDHLKILLQIMIRAGS